MKVVYDKCKICTDHEYIKKCDYCNNILVCYLCYKHINHKCDKCYNIIKIKSFSNNI